jgi:hypothetical protein
MIPEECSRLEPAIPEITTQSPGEEGKVDDQKGLSLVWDKGSSAAKSDVRGQNSSEIKLRISSKLKTGPSLHT